MPSVPPTIVTGETLSLWQHLATFSAARTEDALRHLQTWIARTIDADNVIWIGAVRVLHGAKARTDPSLGWRLRVRQPLHPDPDSYRQVIEAYYEPEHYGRLSRTYYQRSHEQKRATHVGMTGHAAFLGAGRFRVHRMRDGWIDFAAFRRTLNYRLYYRDPGISDRIWIGFPLTDNRESFFLVDRHQKPHAPRRRNFSLSEAALAGSAVRGVPELHRRLFLGHGLSISDKPFSPTQRQVLCGLLTGRTEKEIAHRLRKSPATLHKYVTSLYAHFRVTSRAALMGLWLEPGGSAGRQSPSV